MFMLKQDMKAERKSRGIALDGGVKVIPRPISPPPQRKPGLIVQEGR